MNLEYLQKVHDNILNQNALSKDYNLILAYINIRLRMMKCMKIIF